MTMLNDMEMAAVSGGFEIGCETNDATGDLELVVNDDENDEEYISIEEFYGI